MSYKKQKNKAHFIIPIKGDKWENHRILINERLFKLNDIKRGKLYLKLILQVVKYQSEIEEEDINLLLQEVGREVNNESRAFKRKMGYELGDWRDYS